MSRMSYEAQCQRADDAWSERGLYDEDTGEAVIPQPREPIAPMVFTPEVEARVNASNAKFRAFVAGLEAKYSKPPSE